jgi:post-segregation antitoxin (ccd killing protein)
MAHVNVYLPDELAQEARAAGLNISEVTQAALSASLARTETNRWLDRLERLPQADIPHRSVIQALGVVQAELGDRLAS